EPEPRRRNAPLRTNPTAVSIAGNPYVAPYSSFNAEPYTVEELTARQFRTVFDYITTNNVLRDYIRNITIPSDFDAVSQSNILLIRRQPLDIRYTHLMGWIHELTHSITSISVNRDLLQELLIPRLFKWDDDTDYFRATLQLVGLTEQKVMEILQHCSAVTAHATRMIRVMEAHQMVHIMNRKTVRVTAEDEQYRFQSAFYNPPPWSDEPSSYIQTLRWWRENYSDALLIRRTDLEVASIGYNRNTLAGILQLPQSSRRNDPRQR
ncbi:hypothetical protein COOONC_21369, partial [Cooperia oncophora]